MHGHALKRMDANYSAWMRTAPHVRATLANEHTRHCMDMHEMGFKDETPTLSQKLSSELG